MSGLATNDTVTKAEYGSTGKIIAAGLDLMDGIGI